MWQILEIIAVRLKKSLYNYSITISNIRRITIDSKKNSDAYTTHNDRSHNYQQNCHYTLKYNVFDMRIY